MGFDGENPTFADRTLHFSQSISIGKSRLPLNLTMVVGMYQKMILLN
jgi:hypothetical protein